MCRENRTLWVLMLVGFWLMGCRNETYFSDNNSLKFSKDTVWFDTVFTRKPGSTYPISVTKIISVKNPEGLPVKANFKVAGGAQSQFRVAIDGESGITFNDVEIGANTCIDRGAMEDTVIEDGVILDNLIQIGHNVKVGKHTAMAGCAGVAGSTTIGAYCTIGAGAGILGHLTLVDHVHVSAYALVTHSLTKPGTYSGVFPIDENARWHKNAASLKQLSQMRERLKPVAARLLGCDAEAVTFADNAAHGGGKSVAWADLTKQAWLDRVGLSVTGFYMTPEIKYDFTTLNGRAFYYYCYGAAVSEVEIDTRTGEWWLKGVDIVHDVWVRAHANEPAALMRA